MSIDLDTSDLKKMEKTIKAMNGIPQSCVTKAAKKGANIVLKAAKRNAPVGETKNLKRGLTLRPEKSRAKGKKVYRIAFRKELQKRLLKDRKGDGYTPGARGVYFYPAHQEYGYTLRDGRYKPGTHYMKRAAADNADEASSIIVETLAEEVEERWNKYKTGAAKKARSHKSKGIGAVEGYPSSIWR